MKSLKFALLGFALAAAPPAYAVEIDFSAPILDPYNRPVRSCDEAKAETDEQKEECRKPMTLGLVVASAMFANYAEDQAQGGGMRGPSVDAAEKARRGRIGIEVIKGGRHNFQSDEITTMKTLVGRMYGGLVVARALDLLDPPKREDAKAEAAAPEAPAEERGKRFLADPRPGAPGAPPVIQGTPRPGGGKQSETTPESAPAPGTPAEPVPPSPARRETPPRPIGHGGK